MNTTRKRYSAEFEPKVALATIRGDLKLAELAAKHGIHHNDRAYSPTPIDLGAVPPVIVRTGAPREE